jgi:SAM-dependent methyltransferase
VESYRVDYDRIAASYNRRYEFKQLEGVASALDELRGGRVLEVGCGTGHWLREGDLGVDLSAAMLARVKRGHRANADAGALPFRSGAFDLVFTVNAIHHFPDKAGFIAEARRVLRARGSLAIVGIQPRTMRHRWWTYDWFDGVYERDLDRFPSWGALADLLLGEGFASLSYRAVEHVSNNRRGADIFNDPFIGKDSGSQLALLTDEQYAAGIERMKAAIAANPDIVFRGELTLGMIVASL